MCLLFVAIAPPPQIPRGAQLLKATMVGDHNDIKKKIADEKLMSSLLYRCHRPSPADAQGSTVAQTDHGDHNDIKNKKNADEKLMSLLLVAIDPPPQMPRGAQLLKATMVIITILKIKKNAGEKLMSSLLYRCHAPQNHFISSFS